MSDSLFDESQVHERAISELIGYFRTKISSDEIRKIYFDILERHEEKAVLKKFLPVLVKREVKEILSKLGDENV